MPIHSSQHMLDSNDTARRAVRAMKRAWTESHAIIERRYDNAGKSPRWETTGLHSSTLLERQADEWIAQQNQLGQYRIISIWHRARLDKRKRILLDATFKPTRCLEFFRHDAALAQPVGGTWRPVQWQPSKPGFAGKAGRFDDLAEAIAFLRRDASAGEYRIITIRRMTHADYQKGQLKIIKKHMSGKDSH
jgi:hypothetical protein